MSTISADGETYAAWRACGMTDSGISLLFRLRACAAPQPIASASIASGGTDYLLVRDFKSGDLVAYAENDIAWRYALRQLNPFVIPDISYDSHNTDGSLDLYDPETETGAMTELYLQDRAAMLTWKIRYDKGEQDDDDEPFPFTKPYNDDWDTSSVQGDWDFVDMDKKLYGGDLLTLAIESTGEPANDGAWMLAA